MLAIAVPSMAGGYAEATRGLRPEDVSAAVLRQLVANARKLHNVQAAVITVPATFTIPQKMATIEAARLADLHVRCLRWIMLLMTCIMLYSCIEWAIWTMYSGRERNTYLLTASCVMRAARAAHE